MKFMMLVKASKDSEEGTMPQEQMDQMFAAMKKYNEELKKAGVLVSVGGLHPSSKGIRITYPVPGEPPTITDGPFAEVNELIAGYWFICELSRGSHRMGDARQIRMVLEKDRLSFARYSNRQAS